MSRERTQFKTGNAGRAKGALNKTTEAAKALFTSIMENEQSNIQDCLDKVRKKDPAKYLEVLSKFYPYFIPKKIEVDASPTVMTINVKRRS